MKQIDNRQKQQIVMRAQKSFLGGKNPLAPKEREKERLRHGSGPPAEKGPADEVGPEQEKKEPVSAAPVLRSEPKVGRNDPCPCGSGKKYKKCCLK